jgi:hypothetical protein
MSFHFNNTEDLGTEVHYDLRVNDKTGIYLPLDKYMYHSTYNLEYDWMGELATDMHVTNILVDGNMIYYALQNFSYIGATAVRLDAEYTFLTEN